MKSFYGHWKEMNWMKGEENDCAEVAVGCQSKKGWVSAMKDHQPTPRGGGFNAAESAQYSSISAHYSHSPFFPSLHANLPLPPISPSNFFPSPNNFLHTSAAASSGFSSRRLRLPFPSWGNHLPSISPSVANSFSPRYPQFISPKIPSVNGHNWYRQARRNTTPSLGD